MKTQNRGNRVVLNKWPASEREVPQKLEHATSVTTVFVRETSYCLIISYQLPLSFFFDLAFVNEPSERSEPFFPSFPREKKEIYADLIPPRFLFSAPPTWFCHPLENTLFFQV